MTKDNHVHKPEIMENDKQKNDSIAIPDRKLPEHLFILPTNNKPVFPGLVFPLVLPEGDACDVIKKAAEEVPERVVGVVLAKEEEQEDKINRGLYSIGTAARIMKFQETPDGSVQTLLQAEQRFEIISTKKVDGLHLAQVAYLEDQIEKDTEDLKPICMAIMGSMRELIKHNPMFSDEIRMFLSRNDWNNAAGLADFSVTITSSSKEELQDILECRHVKTRLEKALFLLRKELDLNQLKEKITQQIEEKITKQQREFFLREQLKAIKQELGLEKDEKTEEIEKYQQALDELPLSEEVAIRVQEEINKLKLLPPQSPEFGVSRNYLDWLTQLPWGVYSEDQLDIGKARKILDRDHYGLEDVKSRILEFISVARLKGSVEGSILCLVGPPGVGKTSLGKAVAEALGRKFFRFSLGGMRDEAEIKGHRRTYIGAMPGKFMQAMKNVGVSNPVVMLDEIDKVGASFQGDPASALLEVLDPEQNTSFRDHYLDVPFDLSKVLFIATSNIPDPIPGPLKDRMEMIYLSGYILEEKLAIGKRYLVPKTIERNGLSKEMIRFTDGALKKLVNEHAREAGVRAFEKALGSCVRKAAAKVAESGFDKQIVVGVDKVDELMGKARFSDDPLMKRPCPGVVMGLAWTSLGGSTLYIESIAVTGSEGVKLTGQLGDVMKESTYIAFSLVQSNKQKYGITNDYFSKRTIHVHVPAGATPKDGPSAGITMATSLISLAINKKPKDHWAMTGELTLTGRVLPVGGIKEKIIAAKRSKVKDVILPKENEKDFEEIPEKVRSGITPHFVTTYDEVFKHIF